MAFFNITSSAEGSGATVFFADGTTETVASDNPIFEQVRDGLLDGSLSDEELLNLIAPFKAIYKKLTKLSERVSRKGMRLYFDGDAVAHRLAEHIIGVMDSGADQREIDAWLKFWEKAATNPSLASQDELFIFVTKHGVSITPEGDAVLYKGVRADGLSSHAGPGIVDGVEYEHANLPNHVGAVVEMGRSRVDDNRRKECSNGLHVGDYSYAKNFAAKLLTVLVNPRDVVSVPYDENDRKIRVCRYIVLEENQGKYTETVLDKFSTAAPAPVEDEAPAKDETEEAPAAEVEAEAPADAAEVIATVFDTKAKYPEGSRVPEYIKLIRSGGAGTNLKRYRNKSVTAGRRAEFDEAVAALGLQYS